MCQNECCGNIMIIAITMMEFLINQKGLEWGDILRRPHLLKKILGILLALIGSIILIEIIPLWVWYGILFFLILCFLIVLFKIF